MYNAQPTCMHSNWKSAHNVFCDPSFTLFFKIVECFWSANEYQCFPIADQLLKMVEGNDLLTRLSCSAFKGWPGLISQDLVPV